MQLKLFKQSCASHLTFGRLKRAFLFFLKTQQNNDYILIKGTDFL